MFYICFHLHSLTGVFITNKNLKTTFKKNNTANNHIVVNLTRDLK